MVTVVGKDQTVYKCITCQHCVSILEYTPQEVSRSVTKDYGGGTDVIESIICACCGKQVVVRS